MKKSGLIKQMGADIKSALALGHKGLKQSGHELNKVAKFLLADFPPAIVWAVMQYIYIGIYVLVWYPLYLIGHLLMALVAIPDSIIKTIIKHRKGE